MRIRLNQYRVAALLICASLLLLPSQSQCGDRSWTGKNGVAIKGELIGIALDRESVTIAATDGRILDTKLSNLQAVDQAFVRSFEHEQRTQGLWNLRGFWLTPKQYAMQLENERDARFNAQAAEWARSKAIVKAQYKIIQALPDGAICLLGLPSRYDGIEYTGDAFFLVSASRATLADGEMYRADLWWAGTKTYTNRAGEERTVNSYSTDLDSAVYMVRQHLGLFDRADDFADRDDDSGAESDGPIGFGSGFVITPDGYLLTNSHVVDGARYIKARTMSSFVDASLVAVDRENDLALLKLTGTFNPATFASEPQAKLGQSVFVMGFPIPQLQGFSPKLTKGVISSTTGIRDNVRMYQIDAAVQPGNSGGPLADDKGDIVGVVVARLNDAAVIRATGSIPQNVNYAIKKSYVMAFLETHPQVLKSIPRSQMPAPGKTFEDGVDAVKNATALIVCYDKKPDPDSLPTVLADDTEEATPQHRLDSIMIPFVDWQQIPFKTAVRELAELAQKHDPADKGCQIRTHLRRDADVLVTLSARELSVGEIAVIVAQVLGKAVTVLDGDIVFVDSR